MPMSFPDLLSLKMAAELHKFRPMNSNETEKEYRKELAKYVNRVDKIESFEILFGVGWDRFTQEQNLKVINNDLS